MTEPSLPDRLRAFDPARPDPGRRETMSALRAALDSASLLAEQYLARLERAEAALSDARAKRLEDGRWFNEHDECTCGIDAAKER